MDNNPLSDIDEDSSDHLMDIESSPAGAVEFSAREQQQKFLGSLAPEKANESPQEPDYYSTLGGGEPVENGLPAELRITKGARLFHGTPFGNEFEESLAFETENTEGGYFLTPNFALAEYYAHRVDGLRGIKPIVLIVEAQHDLRLINQRKRLNPEEISRLADIFISDEKERETAIKELAAKETVMLSDISSRQKGSHKAVQSAKILKEAGYDGYQRYDSSQGLEIMLFGNEAVGRKGIMTLPESSVQGTYTPIHPPSK